MPAETISVSLSPGTARFVNQYRARRAGNRPSQVIPGFVTPVPSGGGLSRSEWAVDSSQAVTWDALSSDGLNHATWRHSPSRAFRRLGAVIWLWT